MQVKKIFSAILSGICILTGVLRYIDLRFYTDKNGFVTLWSADIRYLLLIIPSIAIIVYAYLYIQQLLSPGGNRQLYLSMAFAGFIHLFSGVFCGLWSFNKAGLFNEQMQAILLIAAGAWLLYAGCLSLICETPVFGNVFFAVIAAVFYFVLMLLRFISKPSSIARVTPTLEILIPIFVLIFFSAFIRQMFFSSKTDIKLVISGFLCFLFGGCLQTAEMLSAYQNGTLLPVPFFQGLSIISMGLFGLCAALSVNRTPRINSRPIY